MEGVARKRLAVVIVAVAGEGPALAEARLEPSARAQRQQAVAAQDLERVVAGRVAAGRRDADLAPGEGHGLFDARVGRAAPLRAGAAERARRRGLARASVDLVRARPRQFRREEHGGGLDEALEARARGGLEHGPEHGVRL